MWFDIIKDNKRTQYYREFLEEVKELEEIIDSPDNIKKYEAMSSDDRPQYGENTSYATLITAGVNYFTITCRVTSDRLMTINKVSYEEANKQYSDFSVRMFKNEYPELYNKIWDFALFYNKIVNPTLLGKEADKQRALFEGSSNSGELLKSNLGVIYKFIHNFLYNIKKTFRLPDKDIYSHLNPITTLVPRKDFIDRLAMSSIIHDAQVTSTSFALKTVLNRTHLYTVTDYIMKNWVEIINTLRTDDHFTHGSPNIKTTKLKYISPLGTELQDHWYSHYQKTHEEEIKKYIKEIENIPEEDLGNWEEDDDNRDVGAWTPQYAQDDDDDDDDEINALFA